LWAVRSVDARSGEARQEQLEAVLAAVDQGMVGLVVVGQQAAITAGDAFGVGDVAEFAVRL
jgi:hypothetical protein